MTYQNLVSWFSPFNRVHVAFSGGVDSTIVLKAAADALPSEEVTAVTADSPSLARAELESAKSLAQELGVSHVVLKTNELEREEYVNNKGNRCYFCKSTLYEAVAEFLGNQDTLQADSVIVDGTNLDDLGDIRPGQRAAQEAGIRHPLVESGITKEMVRQMSKELQLPTWDKPAMACLASRIPVGTAVTKERLGMVEKAEQGLRGLGFSDFRVRLHAQPTIARIELSQAELESSKLLEQRKEIVRTVKEAGFQLVTLDLEGYKVGGFPIEKTPIKKTPTKTTQIKKA